MASHHGNHNRKNVLVGVGSALVATSDDLALFNEPLVLGSLVYNSDTLQLSVADGVTPPSALPDHKHKYYAPVGHSHITSANEVWRLSNPRLWYTDDLPNHPELIPLDGREITNDVAKELAKVYPGSTLLTHPIKTMDIHGFQNEYMTLSVTEFQSDFVGGRIVNGEIDETNLLVYTDQWLTNSTDCDKTQSVTITFKHGHTYAPNEYWMVPAAGTADAPVKQRPTPRNWVFEGSNDGTAWDTLDQVSDYGEENWSPFTITSFKLKEISDDYAMLRLRITKWNPGIGDPLETGLRRFWIFGNKNGVFTMPEIESPSSAFTWVVPYKDLDIGLKHESIGDVGLSSSLPENFPAYRMPADGRSLAKVSYPLLFNHIGYTQDNNEPILVLAGSEGTVTGATHWEMGIVDQHQAVYVDITPHPTTSKVLGAYSFVPQGNNVPLAWLVEGTTDGTTWDTIQLIEGTTTTDMAAQHYKFYIDTSATDKVYTKYRITFTEWLQGDSTASLDFQIFTHVKNEFYIPNITIEGSDLCNPYIVVNNTTQDVSSEVVASMQKDIASLTKMVAELQAKLNEQDARLASNDSTD